MTSAAKAIELVKWKIWGVNHVLDSSSDLITRDDKDAVLDRIYGPEHKSLLEEARQSPQDVDVRIAMYGVFTFHQLNPISRIKKDRKVPIIDLDVFEIFGYSKLEGEKCRLEATDISISSDKISTINELEDKDFARTFAPPDSWTYTSNPKSSSAKADTDEISHTFQLQFQGSHKLWRHQTKTAQALLKLIKHTSEHDYRNSSMGWNEEHKLEEMKDDDMRYIIIKLAKNAIPGAKEQWDSDDEAARPIIGFLSFMITQEEDQEVLYIFEIHISEHFRKHGLGQYLFSLVEKIAEATAMKKIMLTVFTCNKHARQWYSSRGFDVDEISPKARKLRGGRSIQPEYEILSKRLDNIPSKKVKLDQIGLPV